jgi:hypothetical protein
MISQSNTPNLPQKGIPLHLSSDQTRIASPSDSNPQRATNLNYTSPLSRRHQKKDDFSACSIEKEDSSKLIFPKFSRKFSTFRQIPSLQDLNSKGIKSLSEFQPANCFYSPRFQKPKQTKGFVRPAERRLAEFNSGIVSNFSFTNCFFESNGSKVVFKGELNSNYNKPNYGNNIGFNQNQWGKNFGSKIEQRFMRNEIQVNSNVGNHFKMNLNWNQNKVQDFFSIKDNFTFNKTSGNEFLTKNEDPGKVENPKQMKNLLIKPKTKRIKKKPRIQNEQFYQMIKQMLHKKKLKCKNKQFKIFNNSSDYYEKGFFCHMETKICKRIPQKIIKGIF